MAVFFVWVGVAVAVLALYSIFLWKRDKKRSRFRAKLTVLFLLFMMVPTVPLILFIATLLTQSADMLLLPGIGSALETSLVTIRTQAEEKGRRFFQNHADPNAWDKALLQQNDLLMLGFYRMIGDNPIALRRLDSPECPLNRRWLPPRDLFQESGDSLQTACLLPSEEISMVLVCRSSNAVTLAVVGYKTFPLVLESKEKITHALNVYNTLTLLKESIIRRNIIWAMASLIIVGLAVAAVAAAKTLSSGISEPIQDLVGGMHRVASGDFSRTVESKAKDEFRFLIDSFNVMMRDLQTTRRQLVQAEKRAAWQEAAKRISHEIRNALTPIFLSLRRIKTAQPGVTSKKAVSDHFRVIDEELASLERMSASFSEFARMPQPQKIRLNLNDVVSAALRVAEQESDTVRFRPDLSSEPLMIDADREQVRRLLHNLLKNAAEASAPNTEIRIRTRQEKAPVPSAVIEIEDHGEGMAPDNLARLFQPYFTTKKKGTGLGLVIAQKIAEDHGGKIAARSEKGKGTVMQVAFPLR